MAKKKKGKAKDGAPIGEKAKKVADGLQPTEMSRPQLLAHIKRLQEESDREKQERNWHMLEREKLFQLWNLLIEQISLEKEKLALMDAHMEETKKEKEDEDNIINQQIRFMKQEQNRKLGEIRLYHLLKMKQVQDDAWAMQMIMAEALVTKKKEIRRAQLAFFEIMRGLHWKHAKDVSELRNEFSKELRRLETTFDRRLFEINDKEEEIYDRDINRLADLKEDQIKKLVEFHERQFLEIKTFFNDLNINNVAIINTLKINVKREKIRELHLIRRRNELKEKLKSYTEPMDVYKEEMEQWAHEKGSHPPMDVLVKELKHREKELVRAKETQRQLECAMEAVKQKAMIAEKDRDMLKKEFSRAIITIQRKCSMGKMTKQLKKNAAKRERNLFETLAEDFENPANEKADNFALLIAEKDRHIQETKQDIMDFATRHANTREIYTEAFINNNINLADIGFPIKDTGEKTKSMEDDFFADFFGTSKRHMSSNLSGSKHNRKVRPSVHSSDESRSRGLRHAKTSGTQFGSSHSGQSHNSTNSMSSGGHRSRSVSSHPSHSHSKIHHHHSRLKS